MAIVSVTEYPQGMQSPLTGVLSSFSMTSWISGAASANGLSASLSFNPFAPVSQFQGLSLTGTGLRSRPMCQTGHWGPIRICQTGPLRER